MLACVAYYKAIVTLYGYIASYMATYVPEFRSTLVGVITAIMEVLDVASVTSESASIVLGVMAVEVDTTCSDMAASIAVVAIDVAVCNVSPILAR